MSLPSKHDRFLFGVLAATLALGLVWMSERQSEGRVSSFLPAAWGPKKDKGLPLDPVPVDGSVLNLQDSFAKVAAQVKPAVVSITATHIEKVQAPQFYFGDPFEDFFREFQGMPRRGPGPAPAPRSFERRQQGLGSGVIVDPRGYILTNEHVVRGADELTVTLQVPEERKFPGKVIGADPRTDLAVVKIAPPKEPLTYAPLGDSDRVRVGDWAIAIGSPFGLEQTLTVGVISAVRQTLNIEGVNYTHLLQTDAAINRGNSGGPLLNIRGEVIGINSAIYAPTGVFAGIGFAIPVNRVKDIMDQLIEKGRVVRGWMGVEILSVNEVIARQFGLKSIEGVMINNVLPGSPADKAGLKRGDVVLSFDGKKTPTQEALVELVGKTPPKKTVAMRIVRDGKERDLTLVTAEMPAETTAAPSAGESRGPGPGEPAEWEGARVVAASSEWAQRYGFAAGVSGVVVLEVQPGGLAERLGLEEGDLVASVNRQKTPDPSAFLKAAKAADAKEGLLLDVNRQGRWVYLSFREGQ
ncbi:MAG TPA: Do family serine endopeptidase [Elusimicrobiota bacterium]|nr:Do family serine endopeptidase [Elusimicrobiota bacterium]